MSFFIANPLLDKQISEIRRAIRLSMNGIVSEQMAEHGIIYKQNFGVSIPRLREIARSYSKNYDLARRLWSLNIRETMILATLLAPEDKFTFETIQRWIDDLTQIELIEQACMNLFCKLDYANKLCIDLISSENTRRQITGFILSARIYKILDEKEIELIVCEAINRSETDNLHLYKAIALSLNYMSRKGIDTANYIKNELELISDSDNAGKKYISYEVKEEISILYFL